MNHLTINELAKKTGFSTYEIRRRVRNGTVPHTRVGAKQTKVLINEDIFNKLLTDESLSNIEYRHGNISDNEFTDAIGYGRLRKID